MESDTENANIDTYSPSIKQVAENPKISIVFDTTHLCNDQCINLKS